MMGRSGLAWAWLVGRRDSAVQCSAVLAVHHTMQTEILGDRFGRSSGGATATRDCGGEWGDLFC